MDYLDNFMTAFIDDVLINSENEIEHQEHAKGSYNAHEKRAYKLAHMSKCEFYVTCTNISGGIH